MDLTATIVPRSDQKNADDFLAGPQTFTITADVEYESKEQPFGLVLDGDTAHPYKPGKSMRRVLVAAWGPESSVYVGRRLTLFTDPSIPFGGQAVGGIRISHMSHIAKALKLALTETKGKKKPFTVQPLPDAAPAAAAPTRPDVIACTDMDALRDMWRNSGAEMRALIQTRIGELNDANVEPAAGVLL